MTPKQCAKWITNVGAKKVPRAINSALHTQDAHREMETAATNIVKDVVYKAYTPKFYKGKDGYKKGQRTNKLMDSVQVLKIENGVSIGFDVGVSPSEQEGFEDISYGMYFETGGGWLKETVPQTMPRPMAEPWSDTVGELAMNRLVAALERTIV